MTKRILSLFLSAVIAMSSGAAFGLAVRASETAGEGATTTQATQIETETESAQTADQSAAEEIQTDADGNVIAPETAQAIENADMGVTELETVTDTEAEAANVADGAEEAMQTPLEAGTEMDKSTVGAAFDTTYQFDKEDEIVFVSEAVMIKAEPSDNAADIASLDKYATVRLTGSNSLKYWEVRIDDVIGYIDNAVIVRGIAEVDALKEDDVRKEENEAQSKQEQEELIVEQTSEAKEEWAQALKDSRREELANQTRSLNWNGAVLSRSKGSVYGPSGKETYYNLNMSGCVRNMNRRGYYYDVWVRNDGCKMFGDYIMCAANLGVHPFGSLVECSLGTCIVVDTGGFAAGNPNQLDIAVTW